MGDSEDRIQKVVIVQEESSGSGDGFPHGAFIDGIKGLASLWGIAYIGVAWGAWELMDHVVKFSFVWWLCILAIIAGIPLYLAAAYIVFWLAVAAGVISFVYYVVKYFIQNPY